MNDSENQARSIVQNRLLPADQVTSLFLTFQSDRRGARDFCEYLEDQQFLNPVVASQVRASSRGSSQRLERSNPLDVNTQCVDTAAMYRAQDHLPPAPPAGRLNTVADFSLHSSIESGAEMFGPYRLICELGRGGMGVVYQALDTKLGREVALKMLRPEDAMDLVALERFEIEAQAMARLQHPGIIEIYSIEKFHGVVCLAMPLISGGALSDLLRAGDALELERAVELTQKIALGLAHAHERNIIHRDLKPDNILLNDAGDPVITDFGLAKAVDSNSTGVSKTGQFVGTINFTSPEQMQGSRAIDGRADVFSLGVTLFLMITSRLPFQGASNIETAKHVLHSKAPRLSQFRANVPEELETLVARCLCKDPDERYPTATELAADCARWLIGEAINANPVSITTGWRRRSSGERLSWVPVGVALSLVFATILSVVVLSLNTELDQAKQEKKLAEAEGAKAVDRADALGRRVASETDKAEALKKEWRRVRKLAIAGHSLGRTQFSGANLSGVDFSGILLKSGYFVDCEIENALFRGAELQNCKLSNCNFSGSDFSNAKLKNVHFLNVNLSGCDLSSVEWTGGTYDSKTQWPADFDPAEFRLVKREGSFTNTKQKPPKTIYRDGRDQKVVLGKFNAVLIQIQNQLRNKKLDNAVKRMKLLLRNSRDTLSQESATNLTFFHRVFNSLLTALRRNKNFQVANALIGALPQKHQRRYKQITGNSYQPTPAACQQLGLAYKWILKGETQKGLKLCERLVGTYPRLKPMSLAFRGWVADRAGQYQEARKCFQEFVGVLDSQAFILDNRDPFTQAITLIPEYLNLGLALARIDAKYDSELKTLMKRLKSADARSFLGLCRGKQHRRQGLSLLKKGMLPYVLNRRKIDLRLNLVRGLGPAHPKYVESYQSIVDKTPTYFPALVTLSEVHSNARSRLFYCLAALNVIRFAPELAHNNDLVRVTKTLQSSELANFIQVELGASKSLEGLFRSAIAIRGYCLVQMIAERLDDRVTLPSNKPSYRRLLKSLPPLKVKGQLWVQSKAKVSVRVNGQVCPWNKAQPSSPITLTLGSDLEVYAEAANKDDRELLLIIQLTDGRIFYLSPRHVSQTNAQPIGKRLTAVDYRKVPTLKLDFPACWSEPGDNEYVNNAIRVRHRLEFHDFRHYYNYRWGYKKE